MVHYTANYVAPQFHEYCFKARTLLYHYHWLSVYEFGSNLNTDQQAEEDHLDALSMSLPIFYCTYLQHHPPTLTMVVATDF